MANSAAEAMVPMYRRVKEGAKVGNGGFKWRPNIVTDPHCGGPDGQRRHYKVIRVINGTRFRHQQQLSPIASELVREMDKNDFRWLTKLTLIGSILILLALVLCGVFHRVSLSSHKDTPNGISSLGTDSRLIVADNIPSDTRLAAKPRASLGRRSFSLMDFVNIASGVASLLFHVLFLVFGLNLI